MVWPMPGPLEGCCHILEGPLGGQEWTWTTAVRGWSPGLFQVSQPRLRSADLALDTCMSVSPARSLDEMDCSVTKAGRAGAKYEAISEPTEAQTSGRSSSARKLDTPDFWQHVAVRKLELRRI